MFIKFLTIYLGSHITPVIRYVDDVSFEKLESSENLKNMKKDQLLKLFNIN